MSFIIKIVKKLVFFRITHRSFLVPQNYLIKITTISVSVYHYFQFTFSCLYTLSYNLKKKEKNVYVLCLI